MNIRIWVINLVAILTAIMNLGITTLAIAQTLNQGSPDSTHKQDNVHSIDGSRRNAQTTASTKKVAMKKAKSSLTKSDALRIVANRPEVKDWQKAVAKASQKGRLVKSHIELDRIENGAYVVHVYETVPDDAETSHTATFNWYHVNQRSGSVRKEF
jgi:hypothetical protein